MRALRLATLEKVQQEVSSGGIAIQGKKAWNLYALNSKILKNAHE